MSNRGAAKWTRALMLSCFAICGARAWAQQPMPEATPSPAASPAPAPSLDERLHALELQIQELKSARTAQGSESAPGEKGAPPPSPEAAPSSGPFAWGDFTWMNGTSRQTQKVLDTKYFTPQLDVDVNYTYSFNHPIDNTVVGSTALARNNELELSFLGLGGDVHVGKVRARLMLQYGTRSTVVPRNDISAQRGQFDLQTVYRYISEAYAGYHWDYMHGINLDVGVFMSYVGLFSYDNFENWSYQPSFTSDNTPWFFNGARLQMFPTDRLKVEVWLINGWQSYGKFNELPGAGYQIHYSTREWWNLVFNGYVGTDTQNHPGRVRFHSDNSFLMRYYSHPLSRGLSRAAFSVTFDLGFEQGDGVGAFHGASKANNSASDLTCTHANPCEQDFISGMAYNRFWFFRNMFGWTMGGGFIHNPGRYLVLAPTGYAAPTGALGSFDMNPGTTFNGWDISTTFDWLASENITFRAEFVHREADVPYFNGRGGVTGPDGYKCGGLANVDGAVTSCAPPGWTPDLVKQESRVIGALIFRL